MSVLRKPWPLLLSAILGWLGVGAALAQPADLLNLTPLPAVETGGMDAAIRTGLAEAIAAVDLERQRRPLDPAALAAKYGELGRRAFSYSLGPLAEAAFTNAAAFEPGNARWHYLLAVLFQQQRRLDEAARELQITLAAKPRDLPAMARLGQVEVLRSGPAAGRRWYEQLLTLDAAEGAFRAVAHLGLAQAARANGDLVAAERELEAARRLAPQATEVVQQLGMVWRELGRLEEARGLLASLPTGRLLFPDPEIAALEAAYPFGLLYQAIQARAAGRLEDAALAFAAALAADPGNASLESALGATLLDLDRAAEALPHLEATRRMRPENLENRVRLARAYLHVNKPGPAVEELELVLAADPDHLDGLLVLGAVQGDAVDQTRAEAALRRVLTLAKEPAELALAHYRLARLELARGKTNEAHRELAKSLELKPGYRPSVMGLADLLAGTGQTEAALEVLKIALEAEPQPVSRAIFLLNAAVIEQQRGELTQALARFDEAVQSSPDSFEAHFYRGALLGRMSRFTDAATSLARAVEIIPDHPQAPLALASALAATGQVESAAATLEAALRRARGRSAPAGEISRFEQALARLRAPAATPP